MATAKHTQPGDDSFRRSLLRSGAGAVGLVALVAVVFAGIGALGSDPGGPTVASDAQDVDDEAEETEAPDDEDAQDPAPDEEPDAPEEAPDADAPDAEEPEEEPDASDEPDEDGEDDTAPDDEDAADEEPADREPATDRAFSPDSVTIQVLDGYQADGGSAASSVAATLREEGYRVVAENPSLRYEVTTVLWTPGFEAQAEQVAADLGAAEVRQQPGNLSEQVQVHVVVGADRG
jgi:hypothetical protein